MDHDQRIEQFTKMAEADPDNELGHFSLGKVLLEVGRNDEAVKSLQKVLEINAGYSKAYQMLASAQLASDQRAAAVETLNLGITTADGRGDLMPRDGMVRMLTELDEPIPELKSKAADAASAPEGTDFNCSRCGKPSERMEKIPFRGKLGEKIWDCVCAACWREWVGVGTKVINEMGLPLASPQGQDTYDEHMVEFLQCDR
ncbi:MAG: Fe(2+)-trafficking protein [Planctomycetes bacterium]|nr:Fe(2+)-trafficking protein [Planctomycetota bacterium]